NNLGVRVAKLEANASSVKVSGDLRIRYTHTNNDSDNTKLRLGVNFGANVNDNVAFNGRIIGESKYANDDLGNYDGKFTVEQAYVTVKDLGGVNFKVGRQPLYLGQGILYDADYFDGGLVTFGNALKVSLGYGDIGIKATPIFKVADPNYNTYDSYPVSVLNLSYDATSNLNLTAAALYSNTQSYANFDGKKHEWQAYGLNYKMGEDFSLVGEFVRDANADNDKDGWYAQVNYKGANKSVPGSYGLYAGYINADKNAYDGDLTTLNGGPDHKGLIGGFSYTVGKNIIWSGDVVDGKYTSDNSDKDTWWRTTVKFWF
ncbi:MAG TPA: hypothetical protein PKA10_02600, partial [Selenomonadales bacterium]|nr:hypothetical protein [Selenomonadales bacterium]